MSNATMTHETMRNITEIVRNCFVIAGFIAGIIFFGTPIKEVYQLRKLQIEVRLLESKLQKQKSAQIQVEANVIGNEHTSYIVADVSIINDGLEKLSFPLSEPPLLISKFDRNTGRYTEVKRLLVREGTRTLDTLLVPPESRQNVGFAYAITEPGLYSVLFRIPGPESDEIWSDQDFALFDSNLVRD